MERDHSRSARCRDLCLQRLHTGPYASRPSLRSERRYMAPRRTEPAPRNHRPIERRTIFWRSRWALSALAATALSGLLLDCSSPSESAAVADGGDAGQEAPDVSDAGTDAPANVAAG